ncbi:unnamed protein product [Periconia digitata]|uniref:Uncharacterized protein n=1 Tax=Periconia digitata TaxID=1303443 RepID=A0A9W4XND3_9PLEO|nr:unnamed protein product [Periconia digitata]
MAAPKWIAIHHLSSSSSCSASLVHPPPPLVGELSMCMLRSSRQDRRLAGRCPSMLCRLVLLALSAVQVFFFCFFFPDTPNTSIGKVNHPSIHPHWRCQRTSSSQVSCKCRA